MEKSIGSKIFSMMAILFVVFLSIVILNLSSLSKIGNINKDITGT